MDAVGVPRFQIDESGCWVWQGPMNDNGYGRVSIDGRLEYAHRLSYRFFVGPILAGLTIDHLCRNKRCVNPEHLEAVLPEENTARGNGPTARNKRKTRCAEGHLLDARNTYVYPNGTRKCRRCAARLERERKQRLAAR